MSEAGPVWTVMLTRQAEKALYRLPKILLHRVDQLLLALAENPRPPESHQLTGYDNLYRLPVSEWRITYAIRDDRLSVLILEIAPKEQPERYRLEEEAEESLFEESPEQERSIEPETFYKSPMSQALEDYIYRGAPRLLKPKLEGKIRVLIVDDLAESRENLRKLLFLEHDIEVLGSTITGEEAVQMAVELRPDVVLMDIILPGIDGITATAIISQQVPAAQIIMMSVHGEADFLRRAMAAGAREFLIKPFSRDELMTSIRQVYQSAILYKQQVIATRSSLQDAFKELKERIQAKLAAELDLSTDVPQPDEVRQVIQAKFEQILAQENIILSRPERIRLFEDIMAQIQSGLTMGQQQAIKPQNEAKTDLGESQINATALWFKFYKLGNNIEISLAVTDLTESLNFYKKLGLEKVDSGEKPYPWAVVSDGRLYFGLHQQDFSSPTLSYFGLGILSERTAHLAKLGVNLDNIQKLERIQGLQNSELLYRVKFISAEFESPEGQRVLLADISSDVETTPKGRVFFSKYETSNELSLNTEDVNAAVAYWEKPGFECVATGDQPYPWATISDGLIRLGLHQTAKLTQPVITYFAPDMPDRLKRMRRRGIKFVTEHKDKKGRRVGAVVQSPDGQLFFLFTGEIKSVFLKKETGFLRTIRPYFGQRDSHFKA